MLKNVKEKWLKWIRTQEFLTEFDPNGNSGTRKYNVLCIKKGNSRSLKPKDRTHRYGQSKEQLEKKFKNLNRTSGTW